MKKSIKNLVIILLIFAFFIIYSLIKNNITTSINNEKIFYNNI